MANKELLITLGLDDSSYTKKIQRANNLTKEYKKEVENLSTSVGGMEKDLDAAASAYKSYNKMLEVSTLASKEHKKEMAETTKTIRELQNKVDDLKPVLDAQKKSFENLADTVDKSSDAYKLAEKEVKSLQQQYSKAARDLEAFTNKNIKARTAYNNSQKDIQEVTKTMIELDKVIDQLSSNDGIKDLEAHSKGLQNAFEETKSVTIAFGSKVEHLAQEYDYLNKQINVNTEIFEQSQAVMIQNSKSAIKFKDEINVLQKELNKLENSLEGMDEDSDVFLDTTNNVEKLRLAITEKTKALDINNREMDEASVAHNKANDNIKKLSKNMFDSGNKMKDVIDSITMQPLIAEVDLFSKNALAKLDNSIDRTRKEFDLFKIENKDLKNSFTMLGVESNTLATILGEYENKLEILNNEIKKSTTSYDALQNEVRELTQEYNKQIAIAKELGNIDGAKNLDNARKLKSLVEEKTMELKKQESVVEGLSKQYQSTHDSVRKTRAELEDVGKAIDDAFDSTEFNYFAKEVKEVSDVLLEKLEKQLSRSAEEFKRFVKVNENYKDTMVGLSKELKVTDKDLKKVLETKSKLMGITVQYGDDVKKIEDRLRKNNATLKSYEAQMQSLKSEKLENAQALTTLKTKIDATNKTIEKNKTALEEARKKYDSSSSSLDKLTKKTDSLREHMSNLNKSMSKIKDVKVFEELEKDVHELADKALENLRTKLIESSNAYEDFIGDNKNLENSLALTQKQFTLLSQNIDKSSAFAKEIQSEFKKSSVSARELSESIEKLTNENKQLQASNDSANVSANMFDRNKAKMLENIELIKQKQVALDKENARVKDLEKEYDQLNNSIKKMGREAITVFDRMDSLSDKLNLTPVIEDVNKLAKESLERLDNKLKSTENSMKELKYISDGFEQTAQGLGFKLEFVNDAMTTLEQKSSLLNQEFKKATTIINELEKEQAQLNKQLLEYVNIDTSNMGFEELKNHIAQMDKLENNLIKVNEELIQQRSYYDMLEQQLGTASSQMKEFGLEIERAESSIKKIRESAAFTEITQDINKLADTALEKLDNKLESVSDEIEILETNNKSYADTVVGITNKLALQTKQVDLLNVKQAIYTKEIDKSTKAVDLKRKEFDKLNDQLREFGHLAQNQEVELLDGTVATVKELRDNLKNVEKELKDQESRLKTLRDGYRNTGKEVNRLGVEIRESSQAAKLLGSTSTSGLQQLETSIGKVTNELNKLESGYTLAQSRSVIFGRTQRDVATATEYFNNKIKLLTQSLELNKAKYKAITSEQNSMKSSNTQLVVEIEKLNNKLSKVGDNSAEFTKLSSQINQLKAELKNGQAAVDQYDNELSQLSAELNEAAAGINNLAREQRMLNTSFQTANLERYASRLDSIGGGLSQLGSSMMGVSMVSSVLGGAMIKTGIDFEKSMSKTSAVFSATEQEMKKLEDTARRLGQETVYSAKEATEGLTYLGMAGYSAEEAMAAIPDVLKLAVAGAMDLGTASDLVTDSIAALGKTGEEAVQFMPDYLDKMAKLSVQANTSIEQAMSAFLKTGSQVERLNLDIDQAGAMLGLLSDRGMKAEAAGTALNAVLINLTQETGQSAEAMEMLAKGIGHSTKNILFDAQGNLRPFEEAILDIDRAFKTLNPQQEIVFQNMLGGKTRVQALTNLMQGMVDETGKLSDEYINLKNELANAPKENFLQEMSDTMNDNLHGDIKELTSAISEMFITIMDGITPELREFIQGITDAVIDLTQKLAAMSPEQQMFLVKLGALAIIVPPILNMLGQFAQNITLMVRGYSAVNNMISGNNERLRENRDNQDRLNDEVEETTQALQQQTRAVDNNSDALRGNNRANNDGLETIDDTIDGLRRNNQEVDNNTDANRRNADATDENTRTNSSQRRSNDETTDSVNRNSRALDNNVSSSAAAGGAAAAGAGIQAKLAAAFASVKASIVALATKITTFVAGLGAATVAVVAAIAALVALATTVGDNRNALQWLQEEWGEFGVFIGRTCEIISGAIQFVFINTLHLITGIGKSIKALITLNWDDLDNIWDETWAKMNNTTAEAWSKMKTTTTDGIKAMRNTTVQEVQAINDTLGYFGKKLLEVNIDNANVYSKTFAQVMETNGDGVIDLSEKMIDMLSASSDTMRQLFAKITEGMTVDEAANEFEYNLKRMLASGDFTADQITKDFEKASKFIKENTTASVRAMQEETTKIFDILSNTQRGIYDKSRDMFEHIQKMDNESFESMKKMGSTWAQLFEGINKSGVESTEDMIQLIMNNYHKLSDSGVNVLDSLKNEFGTAFDEASGLLNADLQAVQDTITGHTKEMDANVKELLGVLGSGAEKTTRELGQSITGIVKTMTTEQKQMLIDNDPSGYWYSIMHGITDVTKLTDQEIENILVGNIGHTLKKNGLTVEDYRKKLEETYNSSLQSTAGHLEEFKTQSQSVLESMVDQTGENTDLIAKNMAESISKMSTENKKILSESSESWKLLLDGMLDTSNMSSEQIVAAIIGNLGNLKIKTPEEMALFISALTTDLDTANKIVEEKTNTTVQTTENNMNQASANAVVNPNVEQTSANLEAVNATLRDKTGAAITQTQEFKQEAQGNLGLGGTAGVAQQNLDEVKGVYDTKLTELKDSVQQQGEDSRVAFTDEIQRLSEGINIDGNLIDVAYLETQMTGAGTIAMNKFAEGFQSGKHLLGLAIDTAIPDIQAKLITPIIEFESKIAQAIGTVQNLSATFDKVKDGVNQVALLTGTANNKATELKNSLNDINSNTLTGVRGSIKEIHKSLGDVKKAVDLCNTSIKTLNALNLKALNQSVVEGIKQLNLFKTATTEATQKFKELIALKASALHNEIIRLRNGLNGVTGSVTYDAKAAISRIKSLNDISFSTLMSRLSSLRSALNEVKNTANVVATAVSGVRIREMPSNEEGVVTPTPIGEYISDISSMTRDTVDVFKTYKTSGGFFDSKSFAGTSKKAKKESENKTLIDTLMEQNQLLMALLTQQKDINMSVNLDGRVVAKSTAKYMENEIQTIKRRKSRLGGLL